MNAIFRALIMTGALIVADTSHGGQEPFLKTLKHGVPGKVDACGLAGAKTGETVPENVLPQARAASQSLRILRPNDIATMDFRPDRLTIFVDRKGRVIEARCG